MLTSQIAISIENARLYSSQDILIKELENKNAELERFTYAISHDLKNPLVTIKGFIAMLQEDTKHGSIDQVKNDIERINLATDKMWSLIPIYP